MAGSVSDYAENKILDHVTGKAAFTMPTAHVALYTAAPTDAGGGTQVSGGSYARVETAAGDWDSAASGSISNSGTITFPEASASWGTVVAFGLFDASTAGNLLAWGDLTASKAVASGDTARFSAGTLTLTAD